MHLFWELGLFRPFPFKGTAYGAYDCIRMTMESGLSLLPVGIEALPAREIEKCIRICIRPSARIARRIGGFPVPRRIGGFRKKEAIMARDGNGRDHKAAGRPDGGQYEEKAGQGSDDDLEVPTTAESVAPDEGWWRRWRTIRRRPAHGGKGRTG